MDEPQPELRWAPLPPQPKKTGKVWLVVGLVVALALIGGVLFFLAQRGDRMPSTSSSPTSSSDASGTGAPSTAPEQSEVPAATAPPPPSMEVFREHVTGWLDDAGQGLEIAAAASGQDAIAVVDSLQQDAQRLFDAQPPSSIATDWSDGVSRYEQRLAQLRTAIAEDTATTSHIEDAQSSVDELRSLVGL
ncbi:hypothetical protein [Microbacterium paraoxydans]|uniref:hypothetical protein n=1 Tax=Microbacterium paraoxydans TaxID=199592 RepID=UPI001CF99C92|nr:hypothetical protein [Microbacterium paraoxydans]